MEGAAASDLILTRCLAVRSCWTQKRLSRTGLQQSWSLRGSSQIGGSYRLGAEVSRLQGEIEVPLPIEVTRDEFSLTFNGCYMDLRPEPRGGLSLRLSTQHIGI